MLRFTASFWYSILCIASRLTRAQEHLYVLVFWAISITNKGREFCPWPIISCVILNLKILSFAHPCQKKKIKARLIFSQMELLTKILYYRQLFTGVAWIFPLSLLYPPNVILSKDYNLHLMSFLSRASF